MKLFLNENNYKFAETLYGVDNVPEWIIKVDKLKVCYVDVESVEERLNRDGPINSPDLPYQ